MSSFKRVFEPVRCFLILLIFAFIFLPFTSFATDFNDFSFRLPTEALSDSVNKVVPGDFDGDGDVDLFLANDGQNRVLFNDGAGVFTTTASALPVDSAKSRGVAVGDIDGQTGDDIFIANFDSPNVVLLNDGNGNFTDGTSKWFSGGSMLSVTAAFGNIDGKGSNYLVVGNSTATAADSLKIYKNTGAAFSDVTSDLISPVESKYVSKVILADIDGDTAGLPDLIVICSFNTQNRIYINSGTTFTESTTGDFSSRSDSSSSVALGDVDGVNGLDIFVVNEDVHSSRLLINDGSGVFSDVTGNSNSSQYTVDSNYSNDAVFGDVDGDSDLDIIVANGTNTSPDGGTTRVNDSSRGPNKIFLNNGSGTFSEAAASVFTDKLKYYSTGTAVIDASGKPFNILFSNALDDGLALYSKEEAPLFSVSGTVTMSDSSDATKVEITLSGINDSVLSTTIPATGGAYSFSNLEGGSGFTLTPSLSGYVSSPPAITVTSIITNTTGKDFTLTSTANGPAPKITKFKPKKIKPLKTLKIKGKNFGSTKGTVTFKSKGDSDGIEGKVTKWKNKEIRVKVPFGADKKGKVTITIDDNQTVSKKLKVTPIKPVIKKIPKKITVGKKVTIKGSNFGSPQGDGELKIGGTPAEVTKWANGKLTAIVPDLTKSKAKVTVKTHYGSKSKKVKVKK